MIVIRGAGPVGCALALALSGGRHPVCLVAAGARAGAMPAVAQTIALSHASRLILERIGAWGRIAATPIEAIVVSQAGGFGRTRLEAREAGVPALGYVTDYAAVAGALREAVAARAIDVVDGDRLPSAPALTVHAEGRSEEARERAYAQHALITTVECEPPAMHIAFERFTAEGPLALLPRDGRYGIVWSSSPQRAQALAAMPEREFLDALAAAAGPAPGRPRAASARATVPLALRVHDAAARPREVHIGNAAQALHPVAGQGLNLGLRDAWELARIVGRSEDPGDAGALRRFHNMRRPDRAATIRTTDSLARMFLGEDPLLRAARGFALAMLDVVPPARRFFARRMIFGDNALP